MTSAGQNLLRSRNHLNAKLNQAEIFFAAQRHVFELLVNGEPLNKALSFLIDAIEDLIDGSRVAIVLLDEPSWKDDRDSILKHGLRACWTSPILSLKGKANGTITVFFRNVRKPNDSELELLEDAASIATLAIEHVHTRDSLAQTIEALKQSEESFRCLSEAAYEGIVVHEEGRILLINENLAKMCGYEVPEMIGRDIMGFTAEDDRPRVRDIMLKQKVLKYEAKGLRKDGSTYLAEINSRNAVFQGRSIRLSSIRDITERKQFEEQRERSLIEERNARIEAEKSTKARDNFLAIASHELKTPLTGLKMYLDLLRHCLSERNQGGEILEKIVVALNNTDGQWNRLYRLIDDLLDVSRITAGGLPINKEKCDLSKIVQDMILLYSKEFERADCRLTFHISPSIIGFCDRSRIEQVIVNLISNAIKYGAGNPIEIKVEEYENLMKLEVRDHGIGIAKEDQNKIFDRFGRVASIKHYGGLGLGLHIVREILSVHGGKISVESELNCGSRFLVELPKNLDDLALQP